MDRACATLEKSGFGEARAVDDTWCALQAAGAFVEGEFEFASGEIATLKTDAERLYGHPPQLEVVLGHFATFPCVQEADVLLYVPNGMRRFISILSGRLEKIHGRPFPVAHTMRKPGAQSKYEFEFSSKDDKELALGARRPLIGEDVVSTLGSVAGVRMLLRPEQDVHSLAFLQRDTVDPRYQKGLTDHYLLRRRIPTDAGEFHRQQAGGHL